MSLVHGRQKLELKTFELCHTKRSGRQSHYRRERRNLCALADDIHIFIKLSPTSTDRFPQVQFIEGIALMSSWFYPWQLRPSPIRREAVELVPCVRESSGTTGPMGRQSQISYKQSVDDHQVPGWRLHPFFTSHSFFSVTQEYACGYKYVDRNTSAGVAVLKLWAMCIIQCASVWGQLNVSNPEHMGGGYLNVCNAECMGEATLMCVIPCTWVQGQINVCRARLMHISQNPECMGTGLALCM